MGKKDYTQPLKFGIQETECERKPSWKFKYRRTINISLFYPKRTTVYKSPNYKGKTDYTQPLKFCIHELEGDKKPTHNTGGKTIYFPHTSGTPGNYPGKTLVNG